MRKLTSILLCCLFTFGLIGCGSKSTTTSTPKEETKTTTSDSNSKDNTKIEPATIEANYKKTVKDEFPEVLSIEIDLSSESHIVKFGVDYQGDKAKTMKKMAEIQVFSEGFFKKQKIEYLYFNAIKNKTTDKGSLNFHFENNEYKLKDATLQ